VSDERQPRKRTGRGGRSGGGAKRNPSAGDRARGGRSAPGKRKTTGARNPAGVDQTVAELSGPLRRVLDRLPETQRRVLELRMGLVDGHPHDLADTARSLGLSLSEAREIEKRAFEHIREAIPLHQLQRFLER
jgi:DNA-directed RNA polymerase specialized sigma24 family protein